jgi:hypothetical protein
VDSRAWSRGSNMEPPENEAAYGSSVCCDNDIALREKYCNLCQSCNFCNCCSVTVSGDLWYYVASYDAAVVGQYTRFELHQDNSCNSLQPAARGLWKSSGISMLRGALTKCNNELTSIFPLPQKISAKLRFLYPASDIYYIFGVDKLSPHSLTNRQLQVPLWLVVKLPVKCTRSSVLYHAVLTV